MEIVSLLIQAIGGAIGGNVLGQLARNLSTGTLGNTILGAIGGLIGGYVLPRLGVPVEAIEVAGSIDWGQVVTQLAGGAVSGGIVSAIVAAVRNATARKA